MSSATFSVLIPSFNAERFVEEAARSALAQLHAGDEIIVQDGGSDDGTVELLRAIAADDSRVRIHSERDDGQSDALNRALARAQGEWIVWLNADDLLLPGALDAVRGAIASDPDLDMVCGASQILRSEGDVVDVYPGRRLETRTLLRVGCASFSGSIVARTALLRGVGGFRVDLDCTMDLALQFELARRSPSQVLIDHPIGALRFHEASKSARLWKTFLSEATSLRGTYARSVPQRLDAAWGTVVLAASIPLFRIRLTPGYRKLRRRIRGPR